MFSVFQMQLGILEARFSLAYAWWVTQFFFKLFFTTFLDVWHDHPSSPLRCGEMSLGVL